MNAIQAAGGAGIHEDRQCPVGADGRPQDVARHPHRRSDRDARRERQVMRAARSIKEIYDRWAETAARSWFSATSAPPKGRRRS